MRIKYLFALGLKILLLNFCTNNPGEIQWFSSTQDSPQTEKPSLTLEKISDTGYDRVIIHGNDSQQRIDGWGACFNELGWESLSVLEASEKEKIIRELFDTENGFGFSICRMPVGANDYAVDWYSFNETPGDYEMKNFSIDRDRQRLIPYIRRALEVNPALKIWGSPWCPPTWMKTNGHYACRMDEVNDLCCKEKEGQEGVTQFIMDEKTLSAYALYFSKYIEAYKSEGIDIYAVHVQNEPNSCQNFPSCIWTASDLTTFIGKYLGPHFEERQLNTEIWYGTIERPYIENIDTALLDPDAGKYIRGLGFQWAGKGAIQEAHGKYPDMPLMQTESECGDGSNDWKSAEYTFSLINHYLNHGANAYLYWNMVLDETGKSRWGWKQNSLISIDKNAVSITRNPEYHMFWHFSRFVKPGSVKLWTSGTLENVLAFKNPDGNIVIVEANMQEKNMPLTIQISEVGQFNIILPAKSFNTFICRRML